MIDKSPPNSKDAEISLLCSLILDPTMYHLISGLVTDEHFYNLKHQKIYKTIAGMIKDDIPVDLVTLSERLNGNIDRSELLTIANYTPTGANAEYYAGVVVEKYVRRQSIYTMIKAVDEAYETGNDILTVIGNVQKDLDYSLPQKRGVSDLYPSVINTVERLIDLPKGGEKNYIATGFPKLDRQVRLTKGTLTLIAADAGTGKTSYQLSIMRHMARHGNRPVMFSLEMTRRQIEENLIAQELGICHRDMVSGFLNKYEEEKLIAGLSKFSDLNMGIFSGRWTVNEMRHQMITEIRTKGADCLLIDSMGKIKMPKGVNKTDGKLHDIYNYVCEELVDIGEELDIPVVLTHHLNKDNAKRGKNNRPSVGSLREAGDMWTHNVMLIYRPYLFTQNPEEKNIADFIIGKARDGEVGTVQLGFEGPCKKFYNIEEYREEPTVWAGGKQD